MIGVRLNGFSTRYGKLFLRSTKAYGLMCMRETRGPNGFSTRYGQLFLRSTNAYELMCMRETRGPC